MKKDAILSKIKTEKVVALIRADSPDGLLDCAKALAEGGLTSIELTMTTPGAIRMMEKALTRNKSAAALVFPICKCVPNN